jgi:hypothetical protein
VKKNGMQRDGGPKQRRSKIKEKLQSKMFLAADFMSSAVENCDPELPNK